jgi:hypothetical protein
VEQAARSRFLDLLGDSIQAMLDHDGGQYTGALDVRVQVRDGDPWAAFVRFDREGATDGEGQAAHLDGPGPAHEAQGLGLRRDREREAGPRVPCRVFKIPGRLRSRL